jgi:hypothetical protein
LVSDGLMGAILDGAVEFLEPFRTLLNVLSALTGTISKRIALLPRIFVYYNNNK